jgi:hypothetical protein
MSFQLKNRSLSDNSGIENKFRYTHRDELEYQGILIP